LIQDDEVNTVASQTIDTLETKVNGISLLYGTAEKCPFDISKTLKLNVTLTCLKDASLSDPKIMGDDPCDIIIEYTSGKGCPKFSYGRLMQFLADYSFLWGAAMILVGIFLAFFGNKFVNGVLFLLGSIVFFAVTIYATFLILESSKV
jgi:hypothetical protein